MKYVGDALKGELGSSLYIDVPSFFNTFFSAVKNLEQVAEAVFKKYQVGEDPVYKKGEASGWRLA